MFDLPVGKCLVNGSRDLPGIMSAHTWQQHGKLGTLQTRNHLAWVGYLIIEDACNQLQLTITHFLPVMSVEFMEIVDVQLYQGNR
jgi:hypothetical protein